jgi:hypothetical protein
MDHASAPAPLPPPGPEPVRVDATLVDACLALTPEERLRQNDRMLRTIEERTPSRSPSRGSASASSGSPPWRT